MGLMMFLVPLGLGGLILDHPRVLAALHRGGAAFLLWLAWKIASSASRLGATRDRTPVGFLGAAFFQWVNPKSWLVSASAASTFLSAEAGSPIAQAALLGSLFVLAALSSSFVWLAFGATVHRLLHSARRVRIFNVVMGVLLALSVVLALR
jgi:threonine/homoserine/homoserine lactone efflux protein